MRARTVVLLSIIGSACSAQPEPVNVSVAPSIIIPQDVFSSIKAISLNVYEQTDGVTCDPMSGLVTGVTSTTKVTATTNLMTTCTAGVKYCGTLTIAETAAMRVFDAVGYSDTAMQNEVGTGCTTAVISADNPPALTINMERYIPMSTCGNGTLELKETCEGAAEYCDATSCQTASILVSKGVSGNKTSSGGVGTKTEPFFLWPQGSGNNGRFFAFYTDTIAQSGTIPADIGVRALSDGWTAANVSPPFAASGEFLLPNGTQATGPSNPATGVQRSPQAVMDATGTYYVVFQDDFNGMGPDIHLRSFDSSLIPIQQTNMAIVIDRATGTGEANIQSLPAIAIDGTGKAFIAWQDDSGPTAGSIQGRLFTPSSGALGNQITLSSGSGNTNVRLAGRPSGFVAVWESGPDVKFRVIDASGTPSGSDLPVNTSPTNLSTPPSPSVAALGDGSFAVVYETKADGADIVLQRYDTTGNAIANDQQRLNSITFTGDQTLPRIAATSAAGGSYAIAWLDSGSNIVGRYAAGKTLDFLVNNVTGQDTEFPVSAADGRVRTNPVVVSGGAAGNVIIGWEDKSPPTNNVAGPGIVARLFPPPVN